MAKKRTKDISWRNPLDQLLSETKILFNPCLMPYFIQVTEKKFEAALIKAIFVKFGDKKVMIYCVLNAMDKLINTASPN